MKKLMVVAAVALAAAVSQAASISWQTNGKVTMPSGVGTKTGNITATKVTAYYWALDAALAATTAADIWKSQFTYNDATQTWTAKETTAMSATYSQGVGTFKDTSSVYAKDDTAYGAIILYYDVNANNKIDAGDYFIADQSSYTFDADGDKSIAMSNITTANWAAIPSGGPSPVPEPTSGLLLLLGVAGLVLRRKQK